MCFSRRLLLCLFLPYVALAQTDKSTLEGTPLRAGRPEFLQRMPFFADSSAYRYAVLVDTTILIDTGGFQTVPADTTLDTLVFVASGAGPSAQPRTWLLAVQTGQVTGSAEVTFPLRGSSDAVVDTSGVLLRSDGAPLKYRLRFAAAGERVWLVPERTKVATSVASWLGVGFRFEPSLYFGQSPRRALAPGVFSLAPLVRILHSLTFMGQFGYFSGGTSWFTGWQYGASLLWAPLDTRWYLLVGVTAYHVDYSVGPFGTNGTGTAQPDHAYITLGGGFQPSPSFLVDLSVLFPAVSEPYGYDYEYSPGFPPGNFKRIEEAKTVDTIVKLGICWHTPFTE